MSLKERSSIFKSPRSIAARTSASGIGLPPLIELASLETSLIKLSTPQGSTIEHLVLR
jgi:hypothetical protein